jgi:hypothetical protein
MRAVIAATVATLMWSTSSYAAPMLRDTSSPSSFNQNSSPSALGVEQKALQAAEVQRIRDKKFDDQVSKATASICIGCSPEALPKRPARARKDQSAFPLPPRRPAD